jgi:uncharacterized peroxidase-related enzyme
VKTYDTGTKTVSAPHEEQTMPRIDTVEITQADSETQALYTRLAEKFGWTPNLVRTMAVSPAVLNAYIAFGRSMSRSSLPQGLREQIGLTVSELNQCQYCLAAHTEFGKMAGLGDGEIAEGRKGASPDRKTNAVLQFAREIITERGLVSDDDLQSVRNAGVNDTEIAEIVAAVSLNIFTNYFIHVADPEIDFSEVEPAGVYA